MRIALCSDSHNGTFHIDLFEKFCEAEKVEQVFHMGDMVEDARILSNEMDIPVAYVAGNCDFFERCEREKVIELEGHRILLTHGDRWGVKTQLNSLSYHAAELNADIVCFGHTHRSFCGYVGDCLLINPGALKDGKITLLELTSKEVVPRMIDIDIWDRDRRK